MVFLNTIQDILEASSKISTLSLPTSKESQLDIEYLQPSSNVKDTVAVYNGQKPLLPFATSEPFEADLIDWRRLTVENAGCKAVYEVSLNIEGSNFTFRPGDTIGIIPQNEKADVDAIIERLNLKSEADLYYALSMNQKRSKIPPHIPIKSTIRHVLTYCCDLRSVLKKLFILTLSRHTKDEEEKKILEYLCSKDGSISYSEYILNQRFCLLDLLSIFKSCNPPIQVLFSNLPRLLPRPYSVVNSGVNNLNVIKICFSVMDLGNDRKGLVTGWLESLINDNKFSLEDRMKYLSLNGCNAKVSVFMRKNITGFTPPKDLDTPLILVGPGTGIAPFIGFLEERHHIKVKSSEFNAGSVWLFFGCRDPKLDFIYEKEINTFLNNGTITELCTSFSRVENSQSKYVQDSLMQNGEEIVNLINKGAIIYLCGDLKNMATNIKETLVNCLVEYGNLCQEKAEYFFSDLQAEKRFLVDSWS